MCFYYDYEWNAEISEEWVGAESEAHKCDECRAPIPAGETHYYLHQQEHEQYLPHDDGGDEIAGPWEEGEEPDPGEVLHYRRCLYCHRLLKAIEQEELARGCKPWTSQPALYELRDAVWEAGEEDRRSYYERALAMWPESELDRKYLRKVCRQDGEQEEAV